MNKSTKDCKDVWGNMVLPTTEQEGKSKWKRVSVVIISIHPVQYQKGTIFSANGGVTTNIEETTLDQLFCRTGRTLR